MPYKSQKQERFFHTPTGEAKVGKDIVKEFDQASEGVKLPESAPAPQGPTSNRYTDLMKNKTI